MTLFRQVRRRIERTGELPAGISWEPVSEPTFHAKDGREIDTSVGLRDLAAAASIRCDTAAMETGHE